MKFFEQIENEFESIEKALDFILEQRSVAKREALFQELLARFKDNAAFQMKIQNHSVVERYPELKYLVQKMQNEKLYSNGSRQKTRVETIKDLLTLILLGPEYLLPVVLALFGLGYLFSFILGK